MRRVFFILTLGLHSANSQNIDAFDEEFAMAEELETTVIEGTQAPSLLNLNPLPTEVLAEETLQRIAQGTLGETLGWQPGVNSAFYGQGASRPVIRGFDGFRVRVLRDSVGTLDVSSSSPDHGLSIEPLLLREVEILRGPAALLYGNSALGGAVNSSTRSFVTELPGKPVSGGIESRFDSVSSGWTQAGYLHLNHGDWVLSLTASHREANDYDIPGRARTDAYENLFNPVVNDPSIGASVPIENPDGTLPNTHHESESYSVGLSWLPSDIPLSASVALSTFDSEYGLPFLFGGDANDLFGDSSLAMSQDRIDFRLSYLADRPWLSEATLHFAYSDYEHAESFTGRQKDLGTNFTDTQFELNSWEARLDLTHEPTDWLRGVFGFQAFSSRLDPNFLAAPPNSDSRFFNAFETTNFGIFLNETASFGQFEVNAALRWETQRIEDVSFAEFGFTREVEDSSFSAILGASWEDETVGPFDRLKVGVNASMVERIPTETERFAFWNNPAIQRFLIGGDLDGDPLDTEQSLGLDLTLEADYRDLTMRLNLFHYRIDNFIFLQDRVGIGNQASYTETDAEFYGLEFQTDWAVYDDGERALTFTLMGDWIEARQRSDDSPLPRIPPLRVGSRLEWRDGPITTGLELRHAFEQNDTQPGGGFVQAELPTDSYTELNFDFSRDFDLSGDLQLTLFLQGRNLLNEDRRLHTSFLKDVAPLPGRNITVGARLAF